MMKHNLVVFEEQEQRCYQEKEKESGKGPAVLSREGEGEESEAVLQSGAMKHLKEEMARAAVESAPDVGLENRFYISYKNTKHSGTSAELGGCRTLKAFNGDPLTFE